MNRSLVKEVVTIKSKNIKNCFYIWKFLKNNKNKLLLKMDVNNDVYKPKIATIKKI